VKKSPKKGNGGIRLVSNRLWNKGARPTASRKPDQVEEPGGSGDVPSQQICTAVPHLSLRTKRGSYEIGEEGEASGMDTREGMSANFVGPGERLHPWNRGLAMGDKRGGGEIRTRECEGQLSPTKVMA